MSPRLANARVGCRSSSSASAIIGLDGDDQPGVSGVGGRSELGVGVDAGISSELMFLCFVGVGSGRLLSPEPEERPAPRLPGSPTKEILLARRLGLLRSSPRTSFALARCMTKKPAKRNSPATAAGDYASLLSDLKQRIRSAQVRAAMMGNASTLM